MLRRYAGQKFESVISCGTFYGNDYEKKDNKNYMKRTLLQECLLSNLIYTGRLKRMIIPMLQMRKKRLRDGIAPRTLPTVSHCPLLNTY